MINKNNINIGLCIPYMGKKTKILNEVYRRFGDDRDNVIEPFGGTGAFILGYPQYNALGKPVRRIYNDSNSLLVNSIRAIEFGDIVKLADICDSNYFEVDLCAWHTLLAKSEASLREKLIDNPKYFDLELAGRYIWAARGWIGGGLGFQNLNVKNKMPRAKISTWRSGSAEMELMMLKEATRGLQTFCGDFERPLKSDTQLKGKTVAFFDPAYPHWICSQAYASYDALACKRSRDLAIKLGTDKNIRVGWCGYSRFHDQFFPPDWERLRWQTSGGYALQSPDGRGRINAADECIWFSPNCLRP